MQCPGCFAEIPEGGGICPECGKSVSGFSDKSNRAMPDFSGPERVTSHTGGAVPQESLKPLSLMEAIARPLNLGLSGNLTSLLIISLVSIIPIVGQIIVIGYMVEYIRKIVRRNDSWHFPEISLSIDDMVNYGKKGFNFFIASIVYMIGIVGVIIALMIPFWAAIIAAVQATSKNGELSGPGCIALISAFVVPLVILFTITVFSAILIRLIFIFYSVRKLRFSDAFQIGPAISLIMSDPLGYLTALGAVYVLSLIVSGITSILSVLLAIPVIGWIAYPAICLVLYFILSFIITSIFAEFFYRNAGAEGAEGTSEKYDY